MRMVQLVQYGTHGTAGTHKVIAKGGPGRPQAHPNFCCAEFSLIEHSNTLLKQSKALIVPCQL